jgi:hypothetical protein
MQAYFLTRGKYEEVETFIDWIRHIYLPLKIKNADGTDQEIPMNCMVRPIQLWEFVFPREHKDLIVNSLGLAKEGTPFLTGGYDINPKLWAVRKLLNAKEFEKPTTDKKIVMPYDKWKNINILGIGYKEDGDISELTHERI